MASPSQNSHSCTASALRLNTSFIVASEGRRCNWRGGLNPFSRSVLHTLHAGTTHSTSICTIESGGLPATNKAPYFTISTASKTSVGSRIYLTAALTYELILVGPIVLNRLWNQLG